MLGGLLGWMGGDESVPRELVAAFVLAAAFTAPSALYARRRGGEVPVLVEMYPLEVAEQFDDWPEKGERRRHWATLAEARRLLSEPGLVALAEKIAASARG